MEFAPEKKDTDIQVTINEGFFYNRHLDLPTIIHVYDRVESILNELQYLACVTVQVSQLSIVERRHGSNAYNQLLSKINGILKNLKANMFRDDDILIVDLYDNDTFVIFLSPPRDEKTRLLYHIEMMAERIRINLEEQIFRLFYPFLKEYVRPRIGYALEIRNPMISSMRSILQLITNAKKMGDFISLKRGYVSKYMLQKIIVEKDIQTVYQPVVNLGTLEIIGYEALSRGPEDTEFFDPLLLFIVASESGLSFELDRLCRRLALERVPRLKTDKKIFINTLSMTIHDPEFRGMYLKELLEDLQIKPENVIFEISEKLAIDNYDMFRNAMKEYSDIGIVHAGDDIGTGYSDLQRIMELNPGFLKVDISFVRNIDKSYMKQEIVRAIVSLAGNIQSEIVVEGIETREEYETLKKLKVKYGQGYLFAKPSDKLGDIRTDFE